MLHDVLLVPLGSTILGGAGFGPGGAIVGFLGGTGAFATIQLVEA